MDRHNGLVSRPKIMSESESDSDSSSNACSSDASETIYTESFSSETSTAHSSDEEFIDDSSVIDGLDEPHITELLQRTNGCQPRPLCRPAGRGAKSQRSRSRKCTSHM